jgi:peptidoglycan/xylan/chitin deacetylase (PgdA/CDA1 family)
VRAGNIFRYRAIILLYHRIARVEPDPWSLCVTPEHFAEHLEVVRRHSAVKLSQIQSRGTIFSRRSGCSVAVTFDDGYADNFYEAAPLLKRHAIPASFFIVTGHVGGAREFWWDELERLVFQSAPWTAPVKLTANGKSHSFQMDCESARKPVYFSLYDFLQPLTHEARLELLDDLLRCTNQTALVRPSHRAMTRDELSKLAGMDLFEIGAHTVTHPNLSAQTVATQQAELLGSKQLLDEIVGKPTVSFAYPYGGSDHYTQATVDAVRNAGFRYACTTAARYVKKSDSLLELPRFNITDMNGEEFERLLFH